MDTKYLIKRRGHKEAYDERKVYASVYSSCLNAHLDKREAEKIAEKVAKEISDWIPAQQIVTSGDVFIKIIEFLKNENVDAAFMYETHRDLA